MGRLIWPLAVILITVSMVMGAFRFGSKPVSAHPLNKTNSWYIYTLDRNSMVTVVDTSGVCLYVANTGIAAIVKATLPVGTGCE